MAVFGDTLRQARAHKGVTLREAEIATRINRHWLLALEEEHFDQLPALIYQRGIVRNYATYLNLDQAKLLQLFSEARGDRPVDDASILAPPVMIAPAGSFVPNFAVIAFVVVAMGAMFAWGYSAYFAGANTTGTNNRPIATATPLNDEERFIATNTPLPPTNTPAATAEATNTATGGNRSTLIYPTTTTTPESITIDGGSRSDDEGQVSEIGADEPSDVDGEHSYNFYAVTDVDLLIVVDNVVVWEQPLAAGQATGFLTGGAFVVSFSGAESLAVIDGNGEETIYNTPEFTLPE
jgi:cytoskeleton protein RodZ